jgi:hypothetical protein
MSRREIPAVGDVLYGLLERSGRRLCALAFLIRRDWNLAIESVACALEASSEQAALLSTPTLVHLVAATAVDAIRRQLQTSAARVGGMPSSPRYSLEAGWKMPTKRSPTRLDVEQALLAIDSFPRVALLLTIFEGFSIAETRRLLNASEKLIRQALIIGLLELTRQIDLQAGKGPLWVCRN